MTVAPKMLVLLIVVMLLSQAACLNSLSSMKTKQFSGAYPLNEIGVSIVLGEVTVGDIYQIKYISEEIEIMADITINRKKEGDISYYCRFLKDDRKSVQSIKDVSILTAQDLGNRIVITIDVTPLDNGRGNFKLKFEPADKEDRSYQKIIYDQLNNLPLANWVVTLSTNKYESTPPKGPFSLPWYKVQGTSFSNLKFFPDTKWLLHEKYPEIPTRYVFHRLEDDIPYDM